MALVKCEDCGRDVSTEAAACPNCGRPVTTSTAPRAATPFPPPQEQPAVQAQPPKPSQPAAPKKKNWFLRHKILTALPAVVVLGIIGAAASGSSKKNSSNSNASAPLGGSATMAPTTQTHTTKPSKSKPSLTGPQQQAIESATNYLSEGQGFSRSGMIKQLSSSYGSGFPKAVAVFAVNHLNVNWDQQAVVAAKGYKATGGGFSCSGMIQQLSSSYGSGFTHAQAVYGAKRAGVC